MSSPHPPSERLKALAEKWSSVEAGERSNYQLYLRDLCDALGVEPPQPKGSDYEHEYPVQHTDRGSGRTSTNYIDLYKKDHFVLEAKDEGARGLPDAGMRAAQAQALGYASELAHVPPPYLLVLDVGRTLIAWDRWRGNYGGFKQGREIDLRRLHERPDDVEFLVAVWTEPASLDPTGRAEKVTREVAGKLAKLAASLEDRGYEPERVARFLIRCVFTMFAEDVGLLRDKPFQRAVETYGGEPAEFAAAMEELWRVMDSGGRFGMHRILHFNGHFFHEAEALPLERGDLDVLLDAAKADWSEVEPAIFGTLLVRALDPEERHRLGAEYTPRAYVERLVRPTVEVPIREEWGPVLAEVIQLRDPTGKGKRRAKKELAEAETKLRGFLDRLRSFRFLDPACGSGNFLYVTLHSVKRIEMEVLRELEEVTGVLEFPLEDVGPAQFHGIEVKAWAREIAELTVWIGYHQFRLANYKGGKMPEPVLEDTGTFERRDAVLAWDEIVEVPEKARPDPTPRIEHPVTGKLVPDPEATLPYYEYRGARQAEWPQADFIIGNPPYMGQYRQRDSFGDGYVDAIRSTYSALPPTIDYVMYWWHRAAERVANGEAIRAGLITTNTITQSQNRGVVERAAEKGAELRWAIPAHPWVEDTDGANVQVAMTVLARDCADATLLTVDEHAVLQSEVRVERLHANLTAGSIDFSRVVGESLLATSGLSSPGFKLHGSGFILASDEANTLLDCDESHREVIRPYRNARDLVGRSRDVYIFDFGLREEQDARDYPLLFNLVQDRVKPTRATNKRKVYRTYWWRFGEPRRNLREATEGLTRYIVTPHIGKHGVFMFLHASVAPDNMVICIASDDGFHLGVLSSTTHRRWALATGGTLEDRPIYNNSLCFQPFPFPDATNEQRAKIADLAERLDAHRKDALERDERVTMTGMYNVVEKLRSGDKLTEKERAIHEAAACGVLRDLHDELDRVVADAYGWPWPMEREEVLERLVALHDERVEEEKQGLVRWLRPDYQIPRFGKDLPTPPPELALPTETAPAPAADGGPRDWPDGAIPQMQALQQLVAGAPRTPAEAAKAFRGASVKAVRAHLEALRLAGEVRKDDAGRYLPSAQPA